VIVTCPSCASKYRVRDEAVPPGGAELQCPSCHSMFLAHPPKADVEQVAGALEKATRARESAEQRAQELERQLTVAAETNRRLTDDLARSRAAAADGAEVVVVKQQLFEAQKKQKASAAEVEVANSLIATLQGEVNVLRTSAQHASQATQKVSSLNAEIARLRVQVDELQAKLEASTSSSPPTAGASPELQGLIGAVGPMLWGLEQALGYLEQFAANEATLASHVKQLQLLQKVLARLVAAAK
jgi:predicted Zn finger-like uncharacterized protein